MFSVPRVNVIASDEGFSVEVLGRTGLEYREGAKCLFVDSEVLMRGIAVLERSITRWRPPHDGVAITEDERQRILTNIALAIAFRGESVEIL